MDRYDKGTKLGEGTFAVVYKATDKEVRSWSAAVHLFLRARLQRALFLS